MPEGHTIHRYARQHRRALRGRSVAVSSPQGRFAAGAALLDGRTLTGVDPYGKHLFYRWSGGETLHVHLGLYGGFRTYPRDGADGADGGTGRQPPPPTPGTRLQLVTDELVVRLAGPTACELVDPELEARIRARLGPDPLRRDADPERTWDALRRRSAPIGAALMDQRVVAGIGNVYRAESLFTNRLDPYLPSRELGRDRFDALWATVVGMLGEGRRTGRIVTVDPAELGKTRRQLRPEHWRYVYRRTGLPCLRCGTPVRSEPLAGRIVYFCPTCQS